MKITYLAVDTNFLLHYKVFWEINWKEWFPNEPAITLVFLPQVLRELDEKKFCNDEKIRKRARSVVSTLFNFIEKKEPLKNGNVTLSLPEMDESLPMDRGLSARNNDDRLLANYLSFQRSLNDATVQLITADIGLTLKARSRGIATVSPSPSLQNPDQLNPDKKKIRQLEKELLILKSRSPDLSLDFGLSNKILNFRVDVPRQLSLAEVEDNYRREAAEHREIAGYMLPLQPGFEHEAEQFSKRVEQYNSRLPAYRRELREYYENHHLPTQFNLNLRTCELALKLHNTGGAPGENIDIDLTFPNDIRVELERKAAPTRPLPPRSPYFKPPSELALLLESVRPDIDFSLKGEPESPGPTFLQNSSYQIRYRERYLKHGYSRALQPLYVVFDSFEAIRSFSIDYFIRCANLPEAITGKLHVKVERKQLD